MIFAHAHLIVFFCIKAVFFLISYIALRLILSLRGLTSTPPSPVPVLRSSTLTSSVKPWIQWRRRSVTLRLTSKRLMTSFWLEDPRWSPRSKSSLKTSSTERSRSKSSTRMRLWRMELVILCTFKWVKGKIEYWDFYSRWENFHCRNMLPVVTDFWQGVL